MQQGELAIVLHAHMPYVEGGGDWPAAGIDRDPERLSSYLRNPEGFGTWPFGEEWLWEAIATSYLPLLEVLEEGEEPAPVTLSLTPVLVDQLAMPGAMARCLAFLQEIRPESHRRDAAELGARGEEWAVAELARSAAEYAAAADRLDALEQGSEGRSGGLERSRGGLAAALIRNSSWTSSATHAILPLLATDTGIGLQLSTGIAAHRRRAGTWAGGFWLPECAHVARLDPALSAAGVTSTCVELTGRLGVGDPAHLTPRRSDAAGLTLWPIDRAVIDLVWGEGGYPSHLEYRDYHRYTTHRHRIRRIDGGPYDPAAAADRARADAAAFVASVRTRVADGGICVCALDAELLGHWWYEGVAWLRAVLAEARVQGLRLTRLDDAAVARHPPAALPSAARSAHATSWGAGGDLRTWSGPRTARFAWRARRAELDLVTRSAGAPVPERAWRELLALQASDWAFLHDRDLSGDYPEQRASGHAAALRAALDPPSGTPVPDAALRGLAPVLAGSAGSAGRAGSEG